METPKKQSLKINYSIKTIYTFESRHSKNSQTQTAPDDSVDAFNNGNKDSNLVKFFLL